MKVTITSIAKRLGVHPSTVSLALNNSPKISEATRLKVQNMAKEMNYNPNPYVTALMSSIRSGKIPNTPPTIAFITSSETQESWRDNYNFRKLYQSCKSVTQDLGMHLESFWLGEKGLTAKRLSDILYNRGIQGAILLPTGKFREKMNHNWNHIAAVSYGIYDIIPRIDRVTADHYGNMEKVLSVLFERNFKRVGFMMETPYPYKNHNRWLASFLMEQRTLPPDLQIPPMLDPTPTFETFKVWFEEVRPEVIVCVHMAKVADWVKKLGLKIPHDVSLVTVANAQDNKSFCGIIENPATCGKLAIKTLLDRIYHNEIGPPESPRFITVRGRWQAGETIKEIT